MLGADLWRRASDHGHHRWASPPVAGGEVGMTVEAFLAGALWCDYDLTSLDLVFKHEVVARCSPPVDAIGPPDRLNPLWCVGRTVAHFL